MFAASFITDVCSTHLALSEKWAIAAGCGGARLSLWRRCTITTSLSVRTHIA